MAPKKTPKKLDFGPVISTSSHGSSKQETNDPNDKVLLPDDDDDVEPSVAQNATDSIWNQPARYKPLPEHPRPDSSNVSDLSMRPSLKPTSQERINAQRVALQLEAERQPQGQTS